MELKDRIATFRKNTYNKFYWWRRFQPRQTLTKLHRLEQRVPNGDFEVSDYHWQLQYEDVLEKEATAKTDKKQEEGAIPAYLLDRNEVNRTKVLSNMIKQKRKEKAGKWKVPV